MVLLWYFAYGAKFATTKVIIIYKNKGFLGFNYVLNDAQTFALRYFKK